MINSKSVGSGNSVSTLGDRKRLSAHNLVHNKIKPKIGQPFSNEAWSADVIVLDQQGAHGPSLIWIRMIGVLGFNWPGLLVMASLSDGGDFPVRISRGASRGRSRGPGELSAALNDGYRSYPNKYALRAYRRTG